MRPPHEAGEVEHVYVLLVEEGGPSMRPPHEAGEVDRPAQE